MSLTCLDNHTLLQWRKVSDNNILYIKKSSALIILCILPILCRAQEYSYSVLRDTAGFTNYNSPVTVIHTYLTRYYYPDTMFVRIICFPSISGLTNKFVEDDLNKEFAAMYELEDCREEDKDCFMPPFRLGPVKARYSLVKVYAVRNDLLCYVVTEGECRENQNMCIQKPRFHIRDLVTGKPVEVPEVFKADKEVRDSLQRKLIRELGIFNTDPERVFEEVQLYFDNSYLYFYYERQLLDNQERVRIRYTFNEIGSYINASSPLLRLWTKEKKKENMTEKKFMPVNIR